MENQSFNTEPTRLHEPSLKKEGRPLVETLTEFSEKAAARSREAVEKSVEVAKEHPVRTAVGAGVIGVAAGVIVGRILK